MVISPYRTSVTAAHQDSGKRVEPSLRNGRAKAGAPKIKEEKNNG